MPSALGLRAYISGKPLLSMLQLIHVYQLYIVKLTEIIITVSIKKYNQDVCKYELNSNLLMVVEGEGVMITCTVKNTTSIDNIGMVWRKVKGQATHKLPPIHDLREDKDLEKNLISVTIDRASSVHSGSFSCMSDTIPKLSRNVTLQLKGKNFAN